MKHVGKNEFTNGTQLENNSEFTLIKSKNKTEIARQR